MAETAQPSAAESNPNVQLHDAAEAFKAFTSDPPSDGTRRDERGRFALAEDDEIAADEAASDADDLDDAPEAAETAQPDAAPMPASWSKDDAELWQALPPEAQARIAGREGERERAVNQKFQEVANARKGYEQLLAAANANRDEYGAAIEEVLSLVAPPERPDPRAYGAGTGTYDRENYDLALAQYEQHAETLHALHQQRQSIAAQQEAQAEAAQRAAHDAIEAAWRPHFLALLPDAGDPAKGGQALQALVQYAVDHGIEPALFEDPRAAEAITSAELAILEKARRYDAIKAAEGKVRANPAPRTATPTARPGVSLSRSAQRAGQVKAANQRLAREGSIEAGAAMWKHFL